MSIINEMGITGMGTSRIASLGSSTSIKTAKELFKVAYESGLKLIDTADTYGSGDSERLIAKSIADYPNHFFVVTKAGLKHMNLPGWMSPLNQIGKKVKQKINNSKNFTAAYLEKSLALSLKRLKKESVNAFLLHEPGSLDRLSDESFEALERIRTKGMAQYTGISTSDFTIIKMGIESGQVQLIETPISVLKISHNEILALCKSHNIPILANQIFQSLNRITSSKIALLEKFIYKNYSYTFDMRSIVIKFVRSTEGINNTIFRTSNYHHLKTNVAAADSPFDCSIYTAIEKILTTNDS